MASTSVLNVSEKKLFKSSNSKKKISKLNDYSLKRKVFAVRRLARKYADKYQTQKNRNKIDPKSKAKKQIFSELLVTLEGALENRIAPNQTPNVEQHSLKGRSPKRRINIKAYSKDASGKKRRAQKGAITPHEKIMHETASKRIGGFIGDTNRRAQGRIDS